MMKALQPAELECIRGLAQRLDCMIEEDFQLLAQITPLTAVEWRKRRHGPAYVILGTRVLYPNKGVAAFMEKLERAPLERNTRAML